MDGNGRWAKAQGMLRHEGHRQGALRVKKIVEQARKKEIRYLTLYTFSSENWGRSDLEIKALMLLLEEYLKKEINNLKRQGIRLRAIGDLSKLPSTIQNLLKKSFDLTTNETGMDLILALSYGGREEILNASKRIAEDYKKGEVIEFSEKIFRNYLYAPDIPDPELMIRTSNEQRISNFLLWQLSYTEFIFINELWPDFTPEVFDRCLEEFKSRKRRFGKENE